jgi:aspartate kinase
MSIFPKDFSFIIEDNLSEIFKVFSQKHVKINLMQNSAISFSVCINNDENKIQELIPLLKNNYKVLFNEKLQLITIRYFNEETENSVLKNKEKILEQRSRHTLQVVVKE